MLANLQLDELEQIKTFKSVVQSKLWTKCKIKVNKIKINRSTLLLLLIIILSADKWGVGHVLTEAVLYYYLYTANYLNESALFISAV